MTYSPPKPVILTLHSDAASVLKSPAEKAAYIVRFMFVNPGGVTEYIPTISFRTINAMYGNNPVEMCTAVKEQLKKAIDEVLDMYNVNITVDYEQLDATGKYSLTIAITDSTGIPILPKNIITIADDNVISVDFNNG